jgi:hypothetical protein
MESIVSTFIDHVNLLNDYSSYQDELITLHLHRGYTETTFKTKWQDLVDRWISNGRCKIHGVAVSPYS